MAKIKSGMRSWMLLTMRKSSSFPGTLRAEESLFLSAFTPRKIPHSVWNDNEKFPHGL